MLNRRPEGKRNEEHELKFALPASALDRLQEAGVLRGLKPASKRLRTVYYDTPDHLLHREGYSLRLRHAGGAVVQTLKHTDGKGGGFIRLETEWQVETDTPDLDRIVVDR